MVIDLFFSIPTGMYGVVAYRQFKIIQQSEKMDKYIVGKWLFFLHSIVSIAGIWLLLLGIKIPALIFFTIAASVALYAYTKKPGSRNLRE